MSKEAQSAMFRSIISRFPSKSVLVLGDAIIDEYVYCKDGGFSLSSPRAKKLIYERNRNHLNRDRNCSFNVCLI